MKIRKVSLALLATGAVFSSVLIPSASAGTGGSDNAGILYGQDDAYCDAQAVSISKVDNSSGLPLEGAVFTLTNTTGNPLGVKTYSADPTTIMVDHDNDPATPEISQLAADRITWQEKFDSELSKLFTSSEYGQKYLAAVITTDEATKPGANQDVDPTTYVTSQTIVFPANITAITNPSARAAAMASWVNMAAVNDNPATAESEATSTVADFYANVKARVDVMGAVVVNNYDPENPAVIDSSSVNPMIAGTESETAALEAYNKAVVELNNLKKAIASAGYSNASYTGTTVTFGSVDTGAQNWENFVAAYNDMVAPGAFSFGLVPATYDVIFNAVGKDGVKSSQAAADAAISATAVGSPYTVTTDSQGKAYYGMFARSVIEEGSTMNKTCQHLTLNVEETQAPDGYNISEDNARDVTATNVEDAVVSEQWANNLTNIPSVPDKPKPPKFESGM